MKPTNYNAVLPLLCIGLALACLASHIVRNSDTANTDEDPLAQHEITVSNFDHIVSPGKIEGALKAGDYNGQLICAVDNNGLSSKKHIKYLIGILFVIKIIDVLKKADMFNLN